MKKIILMFALLATCSLSYPQTGGHVYFDAIHRTPTAQEREEIPDGWYSATITYSSHTGQRSQYTLNVRVESFNVTAIDFGNGGSVHRGYNNEGYDYRGGALRVFRNQYGEVYAAETDVYIDYPNGGWQKFHIRIE